MSATGRFRRVNPDVLAHALAESPVEDARAAELRALGTEVREAQNELGETVYVTRTPRTPGDFYTTPRETIEAILPHLPLDGEPFVLDAGSGAGAIAHAVARRNPRAEVVGIERNPELVAKAREAGVHNAEFVQGSFLRYSPELESPDLIIMNPPFTFAKEFVERALAIIKRGGTVCALLRMNFMGSVGRAEFNRRHPAEVFVCTRRPSFVASGKTDASDYAWFVWGPGRGGKWAPLVIAKTRRKRVRKSTPKARAPKTQPPRATHAANLSP
jgi:predicted RNA methylase